MAQQENNFFKTENGKRISYLIHETNTACSYINSVKFYIENNDNVKAIKMLELAKKKIKDSVDYTYKKFKEEHDI